MNRNQALSPIQPARRRLLCLRLAASFALAAAAALTAAAGYRETALSLNPVAYWGLDETNVPAADVAINAGTDGSASTGYYASGVTHAVAGALAGSTNTAALFNGTTARVAVPYHPALSFGAPFSAEAWVKPVTVPSSSEPAPVICCLNVAGAGRVGWVIYESGAGWSLRLGTTNGYTFNETGTAAVQPGQWHHVVAVYDGTNASLYVNGVLDLTGPVPAFTPNDVAPLEIAGAAALSRFNNAAIDEVAIYTNVLSPVQIQAHYQNGTNLFPAPPYADLVLSNAPLMYFRLDEPAFVPGALPVASNQGSLGPAAQGTYQPGSAPGDEGVPYTGFDESNRSCMFLGAAGTVAADGTNAVLNVPSRLTVAFWMKGRPADNRVQALTSKGDGSWAMTLTADGLPVFGGGLWNPTATGTNGVNDGKWHHLAGVYDGVMFTLYVDGISNAVSTVTYAFEGNAYPALLGGAPDYPNRVFAGSLDEVAVFTNALTAQQVQQLYLSAGIPPFVTCSPSSQAVYEGATVLLSATVLGSPPLSCQWSCNGTNLPGETGSTLLLEDVQAADGGYYLLEVTNEFGSATSAGAWLTVQPGPPLIFEQPQSRQLYLGGMAVLSVGIRGTAPLSCQWYFYGVPVPNATNPVHTVADVQFEDAGSYTCMVTNANGSLESNAAFVSVLYPPSEQYPTAVLADGPLAFWRFGEWSQTVAYDYFGSHDGQYTNVALGQSGYSWFDPNWAAAFGPVQNSCVTGITGIDFGSASPSAFSVEAWVKCPPGQNQDAAIAAKGPAGDEQFSLDLGNGPYQFIVRNAAGNPFSVTSSVAPNYRWQHVVGVCDEPGGELRLYVNGAATGSNSISGGVKSCPHPVTLGSRQSSGGTYEANLNGVLDELAMYSYALSPAQVENHYRARWGTNTMPMIGIHPAPVTNYASLSAVFEVEIGGTEPLSYQWQFNYADIPGATNRVLTLAPLHSTNEGIYRAVVTNLFGSVISDSAELTVLPVPTAAYLASNLVAHLAFDGEYWDRSGRLNHGTNVGATTFVAGMIGPGGLHASTDPGQASYNFVTLGAVPDLQFSSNVNFSISCWVRLPYGATPPALPFLGDAAGSVFNPGYVLSPGVDPGTLELTGGWMWTFGDLEGSMVHAPGAHHSINDGNWHHLAVTFDRAGEAVTYLDSRPVDTRRIGHAGGCSIGNVDSGLPIVIGQDATGAFPAAAQFDIDDVGVWRRVLAPLEVAMVYITGLSNHVSFTSVPCGITMQPTNDQVQLSWPVGLLQSADQAAGPYEDLPAARSPYTAPLTGSTRLFRVKQ